MKRMIMVVLVFSLLVIGSVPAFAQSNNTIVDVAVADGRFTTLVAAVQAAGLEDTLRGEGPFTVFAPTDAAFNALPAGTVEALLEDTDTLRQILTYHVVAGRVPAADVVGLDGQSVNTVQGEAVNISVSGNTVRVNNATVIITDVEASNGIIHVIDAVILPPSVQQAMAAQTTAAPHTVPTTGADSTVPTVALAMVAAALLLLGGAYTLRRQAN